MTDTWRESATSSEGADDPADAGGTLAIAAARAIRTILGFDEIDPNTTKPFSIAIVSVDDPARLIEERGPKGVDLCVWSIVENLCDAGFLPENITLLGTTDVVAVMPDADWDYAQSRVDRALERHDGYGRTVSGGERWHASAGIASYPRDESRITELARWADRALSIARFMGSDASFSWGDADDLSPQRPVRRVS